MSAIVFWAVLESSERSSFRSSPHVRVPVGQRALPNPRGSLSNREDFACPSTQGRKDRARGRPARVSRHASSTSFQAIRTDRSSFPARRNVSPVWRRSFNVSVGASTSHSAEPSSNEPAAGSSSRAPLHRRCKLGLRIASDVASVPRSFSRLIIVSNARREDLVRGPPQPVARRRRPLASFDHD